MLSLVFGLGFAFLVGLAVASGIRTRSRLLRLQGREIPTLSDDDLRAILEAGSLTLDEDEPLDLEAIEEEERRFRAETWDEPEEF